MHPTPDYIRNPNSIAHILNLPRSLAYTLILMLSGYYPLPLTRFVFLTLTSTGALTQP